MLFKVRHYLVNDAQHRESIVSGNFSLELLVGERVQT